MNINPETLREICGDSKEVLVYGFQIFRYKSICKAINDSTDIKAYDSDDYEYQNTVIDPRERRTQFIHYKHFINDLLLENYKKFQRGEPIAPLLFVVGFDSQKMDISRIAKREEEDSKKGVTLTELRRCYKLAHEFGEEFSDIAKLTFKFVEATRAGDTYDLKMVEPFWEKKEWQGMWTERKQTTSKQANSENKNSFWREHYRNLIEESTDKNEEESNPKDKYKPIQGS